MMTSWPRPADCRSWLVTSFSRTVNSASANVVDVKDVLSQGQSEHSMFRYPRWGAHLSDAGYSQEAGSAAAFLQHRGNECALLFYGVVCSQARSVVDTGGLGVCADLSVGEGTPRRKH